MSTVTPPRLKSIRRVNDDYGLVGVDDSGNDHNRVGVGEGDYDENLNVNSNPLIELSSMHSNKFLENDKVQTPLSHTLSKVPFQNSFDDNSDSFISNGQPITVDNSKQDQDILITKPPNTSPTHLRTSQLNTSPLSHRTTNSPIVQLNSTSPTAQRIAIYSSQPGASTKKPTSPSTQRIISHFPTSHISTSHSHSHSHSPISSHTATISTDINIPTPTSPLSLEKYTLPTSPATTSPSSPISPSISTPKSPITNSNSHHHSRKLPNSFLSSFRIHEALVENLQILPHSLVQSFNRYISCFVLVQFDVDIGPDLKIIRPAVRFSEEEFKTICFSSLPEHTSNAIIEADETVNNHQQFHTFRFVHNTTTMYANCLFSQCRDSSRVRGYLQESLVIISTHSFPVLFKTCLDQIMSTSFLELSLDRKIPILDSAINNISQWPDITYEKPLELGFLGSVIDISLSPKTLVNPLSGQVLLESWEDAFLKYFSDLSDLYMIYECLLLGRSIIIYSSNPHLCSTFIHSIIDLIRPIPYNRNIREYVTIHSFPNNNFSDGIIGLTNPFLLRGIESIPNSVPFVFLLINNSKNSFDPQQLEEEKKLRNLIKYSNRLIIKNRFLLPDSKFISNLGTLLSHNTSNNSNPASPTNQLFKTNSNSSNSNNSASNTSIDHLIRFHFATLTSRLISPLSAYFGTHLEFNDKIFNRELPKDEWNPSLNKLFNHHPSQTMLHRISAKASLFTSNPRITTTCKQLFYKEFVNSPNMDLWLQGNGVSRRRTSISLHRRSSSKGPNHM